MLGVTLSLTDTMMSAVDVVDGARSRRRIAVR